MSKQSMKYRLLEGGNAIEIGINDVQITISDIQGGIRRGLKVFPGLTADIRDGQLDLKHYLLMRTWISEDLTEAALYKSLYDLSDYQSIFIPVEVNNGR